MARRPTRRFGPEFFDVGKAFSEAESGSPQNPADGQKDAHGSADGQKPDLDQIPERRQSIHKKLERASSVAPASDRAVDSRRGGAEIPADAAEIPADAIATFLEEADSFGVNNFRTAVPSPEFLAVFNRFLQANKQTISRGVTAFADIPFDWLCKSGPLPNVFTASPPDYSRALLEALERMGYRMVIQEKEQISFNYLTWLDVFKALRLVALYKKRRGERRRT